MRIKDRYHVACDLDGTLAEHDGWRGIEYIGPPIPGTLERVKAALARGWGVSIFTARVSGPTDDGFGSDAEEARGYIRAWLVEHLGRELPITAIKHGHFDEFWDDRAVRIRDGRPVLDSYVWAALGDGGW